MANHHRWTIVLFLSLVSLSCDGAGMNLFTKKYIYQASESAPKNYVMRIVAGSLGYDGGSHDVPRMSDIDIGWGEGNSSHIVEEKAPPPKSLGIFFFSYHENQFYRGRFDLPYDKIADLMKEGHYSPKDEKHITYDTFVVGVAPGGTVAVWAESLDRTVEVFFGQAEKVEAEWKVMTSNTMPREEYIRQVLQESLVTPEAIAAAKKNGPPIGLWASYRTRYSWQPVFTGMTLAGGRINAIKYYNGERDFLDYPLDKTSAASTRAVPSELHFVWEHSKATKDKRVTGTVFRIFFDEAEIINAFNKLGNNNQSLQLELRMEITSGNKNFTMWLRNDKESIQIKKALVKNFTA